MNLLSESINFVMKHSIRWMKGMVLGIQGLFCLQLMGGVSNDCCGSKPTQEIAPLGAATTGSFVEGVIGASRKGHRHRFYCQSSGPKPGFLGPQAVAKPSSVKAQPGIFPAPVMGPASLTFTFSCQSENPHLTPVIVKPDGTLYQGAPLTGRDASQELIVASPAQTGIYTLFVLNHQDDSHNVQATVKVHTSVTPQEVETFSLKPFEGSDVHAEEISAEFIYISQDP
jgi:hypothetical protein